MNLSVPLYKNSVAAKSVPELVFFTSLRYRPHLSPAATWLLARITRQTWLQFYEDWLAFRASSLVNNLFRITSLNPMLLL